jgi:hypothetical protein
MTALRWAPWAIAIVLGLSQPAAATIVFQDDFSGDGLAGLNGTTPDISTTGAVWEAGAGFLNDGTANNVGASGQAAHLDLAIEPGKIYTAEATLLNNQFDWIAFGFTVNDIPDWTVSNNSVRHSNGAGGAAWILTRNRGDANDQEGFRGAGTGGAQAWNGDVVDPTEPVDLRVVLDNTGSFSVASFYLNDILQSTSNYGSIVQKPIGIGDGGEGGGIGFSHTADTDQLSGVITNFRLTVEVPEPSSVALGVLGLTVLGAVGRWKRHRGTMETPMI